MTFEQIKAIAKELELFEGLLSDVPEERKEMFIVQLARKRVQFEEVCKDYFLGSERFEEEKDDLFKF